MIECSIYIIYIDCAMDAPASDPSVRLLRPVPCDDRLTSAASKHVQRCRSRPRKQNVVGVAALFSCELETFQQKMLLLPGWHQILVRRKKDCSIPLPVICLCFARTGASPHSNQKAGQAAEPAGSPRQMMQVREIRMRRVRPGSLFTRRQRSEHGS